MSSAAALAMLFVCLATETMAGAGASRAGFSLKYRDETCPYRVTAVFALPGERLTFSVVASGAMARQATTTEDRYAVSAPDCQTRAVAARRWELTLPDTPGLYVLRFHDVVTPDTITVNLFVMVPFESVQNGVLNGYRIGRYPSVPLNGLNIYKPPAGFVEVTPENLDTKVSPHFTLRQFLCKQESDFPKYLVLRERLLYKLEAILEQMNKAGYACETLHVMSGYRTPFYNHAIGNVEYSRHVWGGAADIFLDVDGDEMMDDLNGDGEIDVRDARELYQLFDGFHGQPWYERFIGGLGLYRKNDAHGPFVHVDVRGFRARWGADEDGD